MNTRKKDKTTPIIIGIGQTTHRQKIENPNFTVFDMIKDAVEQCAADTGKADILSSLDSLDSLVLVNSQSTALNDTPLAHLCGTLNIDPPIKEETAIGGNTPQWLVNRAADQISAGTIRTTLLVGGEALYHHHRKNVMEIHFKNLARLNADPGIIGSKREGCSAHEALHHMDLAPCVYPLFENALRYHLKMDIPAHQAYLDTYYRQMAQIATTVPGAWYQNSPVPQDITVPRPENRMIAFPYTKDMNPNPFVNQAAAILLTNVETARQLEIPQEKWVYPIGGAEATDKWMVSERVNYHTSPAITNIVKTSLAMAQKTMDDIDFMDLYSCFPCAAVIGANSIGMDIKHPPAPSIAGGLSFFGGPGNNYTMHAIAQTVSRLRKNPEQCALVTGLGWFLTKHAAGIYSGVALEKPWHRPFRETLQHSIDAMESPRLTEKPSGRATVETYTVLRHYFQEKRKAVPTVIARMDDGTRCLATTPDDTDLYTAMETQEFIGKTGMVSPGNGGPNLIRF